MPEIAIIDYGVGNLRSVMRGLEKAGAHPRITADRTEIASADGIVLPGVGAFREGMEMLGQLQPVVRQAAGTVPLLGICLGMQMLMEWSEERGIHRGLGLIPGIVTRLTAQPGKKVPHMGWNTLQIKEPEPLLTGLRTREHVYFVHSYYVSTLTPYVLSTTEYICPFASCIGKDQVFGVQFHPEKSGVAGLTILKNFIDLCSG
ncbi:MAG: imidazole glycerol phosphate synthase subunit HisH [Methanomicrobiales archaeon]|nr:imidazole glycerol phosphate synthase subunit HisH [Methanomicrobiales archaeon]